MFAALALGVFERLKEKATVEELARVLSVEAEPLERLLDACVGLNLLRRSGSLYENLAVSRTYLCRDSPHSLSGYILYSNEVLFSLWSHLEDAVREGTPRWQQCFGAEGSIFDHFFRTAEARQTFLQGMHGLGALSSPAVVKAFDLSRFRQLIDLGGATGHLAITACESYPELHATVFDLEAVIEVARGHIGRSAASQRIHAVVGDFFLDELPDGDLIALGRIIHDWSDDKVRKLLAKVYQRLPPGGGILLAEKLLYDDKSGPVSAQLQSINMLICTEGRERSLAEYRKLLKSAGFHDVQGRFTQSPLDAIFAVKPHDQSAK
jgi:acetylserotonin N-methyltransferase